MIEENRRYRRLRLRLPISRIAGDVSLEWAAGLATGNISAGGMYFRVPAGPDEPATGTVLSFELVVPPGEGHSPYPGRVRGSGQVVRTDRSTGDAVGVAVQFTRPLSLEF